jgi:hypothetical protein
MVHQAMLLDVRQLKRKKITTHEACNGVRWNKTQTNECIVFLSRCSCGNNEWENREHLGRLENSVFSSLAGVQWKGRWMVTTEGNIKSVEVTKNETSTCHMSHGANQTINRGLKNFFKYLVHY